LAIGRYAYLELAISRSLGADELGLELQAGEDFDYLIVRIADAQKPLNLVVRHRQRPGSHWQRVVVLVGGDFRTRTDFEEELDSPRDRHSVDLRIKTSLEAGGGVGAQLERPGRVSDRLH